jgi:hypothetical protein
MDVSGVYTCLTEDDKSDEFELARSRWEIGVVGWCHTERFATFPRTDGNGSPALPALMSSATKYKFINQDPH